MPALHPLRGCEGTRVDCGELQGWHSAAAPQVNGEREEEDGGRVAGACARYAHVFIGDTFKPGLASIAAGAVLAEGTRLVPSAVIPVTRCCGVLPGKVIRY